MSTSAFPGRVSGHPEETAREAAALREGLMKAVYVLASLKLTVVLFVLGMIIVFVGSLAQSRRDVWLVMSEYFRTYLAWIDVADLFPPSMFPALGTFEWNSLKPFRYIPFPGGWTIGWIMLANLTAAHVLKFRIRVTGKKLLSGILTVVAGIVLTTVVVVTGNAQTGVESGTSLLTPGQIWILLLAVLGLTSCICMASAVLNKSQSNTGRVVLGLAALALGGVLAWFIIGGESARLNVSSMRILWQLLKGGACSMVLLLGCNQLFDKRGGIVLLHVGVAMLMFSELQVGLYGKENMLGLEEGKSQQFLQDIRERELAVVHRTDDGKESVVVVPQALLEEAAAAEDSKAKIIALESLPFDISVRRFYRNSRLRPAMPDDKERMENGLGSFAVPVELDPVTGMDDTSDQSAVYVDLIDRGNGSTIRSLLVAQDVSELRAVPIAEQAKIGNTDYQFYLRFQRNYRDYEVELLDVSRVNYVGSSTPRDYRSKILIKDPKTKTAEEFTLWMNNPLRYRGETFYQSGYRDLGNGREATTLSVVRNTGWMLPYIACMIVSFGMFAQFWQTVSRYLKKEERVVLTSGLSPNGVLAPGSAGDVMAYPRSGDSGTAPEDFVSTDSQSRSVWARVFPLMIIVLCIAWLAKEARTPKDVPKSMNLFSFAQLPVAWNGRAQPVDSVARTQLLIISHKSTFQGEMDQNELDQQREKLIAAFRRGWPSVNTESLSGFSADYPGWIAELSRLSASGVEAIEERMRPLMVRRMEAVRWFLDLAARPEVAERHRIIKIEDDQVLSLLGLPKRSGLTFSLAEIRENLKELQPIYVEVIRLRREGQDNAMTTLQRRVGALFETVSRIDGIQHMFQLDQKSDLLTSLVSCWTVLQQLGDSAAVMAVPTGNTDEQRSWETVRATSALLSLSEQLSQQQLTTLDDLLAYTKDKLPRKSVADALAGTYRILGMNQENPGGPALDAEAIQKRAALAASQLEEPFLKRIVAVIAAASPGTTPEEMAVALTDAQCADIAADKIGSVLFEIVTEISRINEQDPRLQTIQKKLRALGSENESEMGALFNQELVRLAWSDISKRAGHLLPGGENVDVFTRNANSFVSILTAWQDGDADRFNSQVADYRTTLTTEKISHLDPQKVRAEALFNFYEPFYKATCLYLPVIVLSFCGWLFWGPVFRRTSTYLMILAFVLHSAALLVRMWISGRPPVTNLYSSSIFIGWAMVVSAFIIERMQKNGIGNILGASVGAATLTIAHYLARDEGDTLGVMQAVLDTTFWLATHVVCITLGYAATFLAGSIAIVHVVRSNLPATVKSERELKTLSQLVYGVLCFALFFSLVGTVLGGLWADDSWGRFWGWDPKENGAMLIVLWNALILHARWDKLVRDYGTSVLAIAGNIVTAWSWFGVNELKAGLHTYGFTEGRLFALVVFVASQFALILLAVAPVIWRRLSGKTSTLA